MDSGPNAFKVIPLAPSISLEAAQSKAQFLSDMSFGVVSMRKGFGIRVQREEFDKAARALRPDDAAILIGKLYHVSGLPLACGKEALVAFMHDWRITPVYTFVQGRTRTWAVRAETAPVTETFQQDDGLVLVKEAPPRPTQQRQTAKWAPATGNMQPVKFPTTWAEVAQGCKKKEIGSGRGQEDKRPTFVKGGHLSIQEVSGADPGRSTAAASSAAPVVSAESSIAAAVGKIDELLASLRRLEDRVDGITTEIAELKVGGGGDAMLTDDVEGRDQEPQGRRKTLRLR